MLRIILRILIILLVTGAICGGVYLLAQSDAGRSLLVGNTIRLENRGQFESNGVFPNNRPQGGTNRRNPGPLAQDGQSGNVDPRNNGAMPPAGFERGGRERGEQYGLGWTAGLVGIARNLGMIAVITVGVVMVQQTFGWMSRRRRAKPV